LIHKKLGGTHPTEPSEPRSTNSKAPDNQTTCLSAAEDVVVDSEATVAVEVAVVDAAASSLTAHLRLCSVCASKHCDEKSSIEALAKKIN
jgi:hypothetical protein